MDRIEVQVGQVWADNDPRSKGRTLKVLDIDRQQEKALCVVLTDSEFVTLRPLLYSSSAGRETKISLKRFKPTSSGYTLVNTENVTPTTETVVNTIAGIVRATPHLLLTDVRKLLIERGITDEFTITTALSEALGSGRVRLVLTDDAKLEGPA